ncbi:MAG: V-type ATP synthase subunit E [Methanomethylovorans sp.]|jgi:V/A-type H+-transporting ATPase subunit E|nr:V-type ATP synthase subunit E [Methanomethylovorans sp.]
MGLETVIKDIQDAANAEVSRIKTETDAEVLKIIEEAKDEAKRIMGESLAKAEDDIKRMKQQEISSANLEVKRTLLNARKEILEEVYDRAFEAISSLPEEKERELLKVILQNNEAKGKKIYSNAKSEKLVRELSSLEYGGNIDCAGGVVIENEDGTIRLDYTYDVILKGVNEQCLKQTSDILFG